MTYAIKFLGKDEAANMYNSGKLAAVILSPHIQRLGRSKVSSLVYRLPSGEQGSLAFRIYDGKTQGIDETFDSIILRYVKRFGSCLVAKEGGGQASLWYQMQ